MTQASGSQNPDRDAEIIKLWDQGRSAGDIAKALSRAYPGITRNVVIGVAQRRGGRDHRAKPSAPRKLKPKPAAPPKANRDLRKINPRYQATIAARASAQAGLGNFTRDSATPTKPPQYFKWEEPRADSVSLLDLAPTACKWPMGDDRQNPMCCGRPRVDDKLPYCQHHENVAHGRSGEA